MIRYISYLSDNPLKGLAAWVIFKMDDQNKIILPGVAINSEQEVLEVGSIPRRSFQDEIIRFSLEEIYKKIFPEKSIPGSVLEILESKVLSLT